MRTHSQDFKEELTKLGKQQKVLIEFGNNSLTNKDINSISFTFDTTLLKSIMTSLTIDSNIEIPKNTEINFKYGLLIDEDYEYIDFGNFIVTETEKQEDTYSYRIIAHDKMVQAMQRYEPLQVNYPLTNGDFFEALATELGYDVPENYENMLVNSDKILTYDVFNNIGYTYRDVLDDIAEANGVNFIMNGNTLDIISITQLKNSSIADTIDKHFLNDANVNFGEIFGPINSVVLSRSVEDNIYQKDNESIENNGLFEIKISDNQIMNDNNRGDYLPAIYNALHGLSYSLNNYKSKGIVYLEPLEKYAVNIGNETYNCILMNDEIIVMQGLEENIYTEPPTQSQTDYKTADKTEHDTSLIVDKVNKQIRSVVSEIGDRSNKTTTITQDIDGIEVIVQDFEDLSETQQGIGTLNFDRVNHSQPMYIRIYPTIKDIGLTPSKALTPSQSLTPSSIKLHFYNTTTDTDIVYTLPSCLRYLSLGVFDEFVLDYKLKQCYIIRRVGVENGVKYALETEITEEYEFPTILLTDGDYDIYISRTAYSEIKLMKQNDLTSQFASEVEVQSSIKVNADAIQLETQLRQQADDEMKDEVSAELALKLGRDENDQVISMINASADVIELNSNRLIIDSTNFSLSEDGNITAVSGDIGGFSLNSTSFQGTIDGIYDFDNYDLATMSNILLGNLEKNQLFLNIYDVTGDDDINSGDLFRVVQYINKILENTKTVTGSIQINSNNPKNCLSIYNDTTKVVSLGVNGVDTFNLTSQNLSCGEYVNNTFYGVTINGDYSNLKFNFKGETDNKVVINGNGIQVYDSDIYCNQNLTTDLDVTCRNVIQTSQEKDKKDFKKFTGALDELKNIDIYQYHLKNENENDKKHLGFVIGDKYNYSKVVTSKDNDGVDVYSFVSLCCKAIQEQQEQIEELKARLEKLENK